MPDEFPLHLRDLHEGVVYTPDDLGRPERREGFGFGQEVERLHSHPNPSKKIFA